MTVLSFDQISKAKKHDPTNDLYEMDVTPQQLGLDPEVTDGERVTLKYRPLTQDDEADIAYSIKDIKDPVERSRERDFEWVRRALVEPEIPKGHRGRTFLEGMAPGTLIYIRINVETASGYQSDYAVRSPKEAQAAVKNSESTSPISISTTK